jgi:purine-binding chemotaxis protein CheW
MDSNEKENEGLTARLEEIRSLENKLIKLKRMLITEGSSSISESTEEEMTFLLIRIQNKCFALPITFVTEVMQMIAVGELSEETWGVIGLVNYHGKLISVVDLSDIVGMGEASVHPSKTLILCSLEPFNFGLMVDEALDVVSVPNQDIKVAEEILPGLLKDMGVINLDDTNAVILDLWSLVLSIQVKKMSDETMRDEERGAETTEGIA